MVKHLDAITRAKIYISIFITNLWTLFYTVFNSIRSIVFKLMRLGALHAIRLLKIRHKLVFSSLQNQVKTHNTIQLSPLATYVIADAQTGVAFLIPETRRAFKIAA